MSRRGPGSRPWRPAAGMAALKFRAELLAGIRVFFATRGVLEVTTPALAASGATDPQIESFLLEDAQGPGWLQSSPEFHMKRLLAAGSGAIYQLGPAFRQEEQGRWHNREFTLLEWYRPDFDHHRLMDEVQALWTALVPEVAPNWPRYRYAQLFADALQLDISHCDTAALRAALHNSLGELPSDLDRSGLLDAAMGLLIGPQLGQDTPCFVYDYPAEQAALAQVRDGQWASRFELYWQGIELANGFHELRDASEQRRRFGADLQARKAQGKAAVKADEALLAALEHGLPDCAGVALGVDRWCALLLGADELAAVLAFPADRA